MIFVFFQTPFHLAAWNGKGDVVEILLRNGANIHEKDVRYHTQRRKERETEREKRER